MRLIRRRHLQGSAERAYRVTHSGLLPTHKKVFSAKEAAYQRRIPAARLLLRERIWKGAEDE
jgi:hypothetical protein